MKLSLEKRKHFINKRKQKSRSNGDAVEKRILAHTSKHGFAQNEPVTIMSIYQRRKTKEQTLQIGEKKLLQESSDLASTKASRQNVDEYQCLNVWFY